MTSKCNCVLPALTSSPSLSLFRHVGSHPYTPYSSVLGGVVNELHRSIFLAISAETHPSSLTQIIKVQRENSSLSFFSNCCRFDTFVFFPLSFCPFSLLSLFPLSLLSSFPSLSFLYLF